MADIDEKKSEELGLIFGIPKTRSKAERLKFYNPSLLAVREAVLCTLQIECQGRTEALQCLDAISGTGLAALQWKKRLGEAVQVVASQPDTSCFHGNCETNNVQVADWPIAEAHRPGEYLKCKQSEKEVYVCPENGHIAMHRESFSFVYLQPSGTTSAYMDSLFTNLRHKGVVCLVSPDISSQCVRTCNLIHRYYHAHVIKTDYLREMAARVIIGAAARSAARYNKGIEVLYTISMADHLLTAIRVTRKQGEQNIKQSRHLLHCRMCEERVVYPDTHTVLESPYQLLPCDCKSKNPGRTAVVLGPMWCGNIFSVSYLEKLKSQVMETFPKTKLNILIDTVLTEAKCEGMQVSRNNSKQEVPLPVSRNNSKQGVPLPVPDTETEEQNTEEPASKKQKLENGDHAFDTVEKEISDKSQRKPSDTESNNCEKPEDSSVKNSVVEARRTTTDGQPSASDSREIPLFYHGLHQKKFQTALLPKSDKLVTMLRSRGFRASRTHFDPTAIRTDATIKQMRQVMGKEPVNR